MQKSIKLDSLIALAILGIFIYRRFIRPSVEKDQPKHFDDDDMPIPSTPPSKYDPRLDYGQLAWEVYYESHKGEQFAEDVKRIIDKHRIVDVENVKNSN